MMAFLPNTSCIVVAWLVVLLVVLSANIAAESTSDQRSSSSTSWDEYPYDVVLCLMDSLNHDIGLRVSVLMGFLFIP